MEKAELIKEILELQQVGDIILKRFAPEPWIELNLTIAQLKSLFFIADREKTNFKKLAEALNVTPPNVTGIIDRLVEQKLVSRTENPEDRRIMLLQITDEGRKLLNNLREKRTTAMTKIMGHLTIEQLNIQKQSVQDLIKAAEKYRDKLQS
jgi:MarR family transcriptional regulator, organic hydroperoxide resistance regulator